MMRVIAGFPRPSSPTVHHRPPGRQHHPVAGVHAARRVSSGRGCRIRVMEDHMPDKRIIAVVGATGMQGGAL